MLGDSRSTSLEDSADKAGAAYGGNDAWVVKIDSVGVIEWEKTYGGDKGDGITDAVPVAAGGYLLVGSTYSETGPHVEGRGSLGNLDYWVLRIDALGTALWDTRLGTDKGDMCSAVLACDDGGFLLGGESEAYSNGDKTGYIATRDIWVVKIDATGTKVWDRSYGGAANDSESFYVPERGFRHGDHSYPQGSMR